MDETSYIPHRPHLPSNTHKGEYGKILVIGGSAQYYGAPILTGLGAECAGSDLITIYLPKEHALTAKNYSLNFFVKTFKRNSFTIADVPSIVKESQKQHVMVIGNGIGNSKATQKAILKLLKNISIPVVIDAEALFPEILTIQTEFKKDWILTPHQKEFERLFQSPFSSENFIKKANAYDFTFLVKGQIDYIASKNALYENHTGCVQMRVGGTGDVLAGIVASYRAQGLESLSAACAAAHYYGLAGEKLAQKKWCFSALELAKFYKKK